MYDKFGHISHGFPTGEAYPCCLGEMEHPIGDMRKNTLEEIWHGEKYKQMRQNMLDDLFVKNAQDVMNRKNKDSLV